MPAYPDTGHIRPEHTTHVAYSIKAEGPQFYIQMERWYVSSAPGGGHESDYWAENIAGPYDSRREVVAAMLSMRNAL